MLQACINFCHINSWIAVFTLAFFTWVSHKEPLLLEIKEKKDDAGKITTHHVEDGQKVLLISTIVYGIMAILLSFYVCFVRKDHQEMNMRQQANIRISSNEDMGENDEE